MSTRPQDGAAQLVDVRSRGEYESGHIEGSINLPLDELARRASDVLPDKTQQILLCCASGMRSHLALALLARMGYSQVQDGGGIGGLALSLSRPIRRG